MDKLTKKQQGFVKDYVETGNGTQAALRNYDTDNPDVAKVIASENLTKPNIQEAIKSIAEKIDDKLVVEKHKRLFEQKQLAYFTFPKSTKDDEIIGHMKANGLDLIVIRESDRGRLAFYSIDDANAIKSALDMAYKLKGAYATEGSVNLNIGKLEAVLVKFIDGKDDRDTNRIPKTV